MAVNSNCYVALVSGGVVGKLSRLFGMKYHHVLLIDALDPIDRKTWQILQSNWSGVTQKRFERADLSDHFVILACPELSTSVVDRIIYYARGCVGKLYGWRSLPELLWRILKQWLAKCGAIPISAFDLSYVCSAFVADAFRGGGWPLFGPEKILVLPDDYLELAEKGTLTIIVEREPPPAHAKVEKQ